MIVEIDRDTSDRPVEEPARKEARGRAGHARGAGCFQAQRDEARHEGQGVLPEELVAVIDRRKEEFIRQSQPTTPFEEYLVGEMAIASAWLDRCNEIKIGDLNRCIDRAVLRWDKDRREMVEDLAVQLPKAPARIAS